jgi:hypothetical protein
MVGRWPGRRVWGLLSCLEVQSRSFSEFLVLKFFELNAEVGLNGLQEELTFKTDWYEEMGELFCDDL